jgi:hypothetical protein
MIRHLVVQAEMAEPTIGQNQVMSLPSLINHAQCAKLKVSEAYQSFSDKKQ